MVLGMKNTNGFSMMELMTVIAIIIAMVGLGIPAYNSWRNRSGIARAKATIAKIELALERYKADNGAYPFYAEELNNPVLGGPKITNILGDYMTFDKKYLASGNPPEHDPDGNILLDPWGNYYVVFVDHDANPDTVDQWPNFNVNRSTTYIYSYGPDGEEEHEPYNHPENLDNIDNFKSI